MKLVSCLIMVFCETSLSLNDIGKEIVLMSEIGSFHDGESLGCRFLSSDSVDS